jgi:hypothetical protein
MQGLEAVIHGVVDANDFTRQVLRVGGLCLRT